MNNVYNLEDFVKYNNFYKFPRAKDILLELFGNICPCCRNEFKEDDKIHIGHMVPQSCSQIFERYFHPLNVDNILNLQLEHQKCNIEKNNHFVDNPKVLQASIDYGASVVSRKLDKILADKPTRQRKPKTEEDKKQENSIKKERNYLNDFVPAHIMKLIDEYKLGKVSNYDFSDCLEKDFILNDSNFLVLNVQKLENKCGLYREIILNNFDYYFKITVNDGFLMDITEYGNKESEKDYEMKKEYNLKFKKKLLRQRNILSEDEETNIKIDPKKCSQYIAVRNNQNILKLSYTHLNRVEKNIDSYRKKINLFLDPIQFGEYSFLQTNYYKNNGISEFQENPFAEISHVEYIPNLGHVHYNNRGNLTPFEKDITHFRNDKEIENFDMYLCENYLKKCNYKRGIIFKTKDYNDYMKSMISYCLLMIEKLKNHNLDNDSNNSPGMRI